MDNVQFLAKTLKVISPPSTVTVFQLGTRVWFLFLCFLCILAWMIYVQAELWLVWSMCGGLFVVVFLKHQTFFVVFPYLLGQLERLENLVL